MRTLLTALLLVLTLVLAPAAIATPGTTPGTPEHARGKTFRYWERQLHTDIDPGPRRAFLLDYRIVRCGPRACIVSWHRRYFNDNDTAFREFKGVDACYAPRYTVTCHERSRRPV